MNIVKVAKLDAHEKRNPSSKRDLWVPSWSENLIFVTFFISVTCLCQHVKHKVKPSHKVQGLQASVWPASTMTWLTKQNMLLFFHPAANKKDVTGRLILLDIEMSYLSVCYL